MITWTLTFSALCKSPLARYGCLGLLVTCELCQRRRGSQGCPTCAQDVAVGDLLTFSLFIVASLPSDGKPRTQRCFCVPWRWHHHWVLLACQRAVCWKGCRPLLLEGVSWAWRGSCGQVGLRSQKEQDWSCRHALATWASSCPPRRLGFCEMWIWCLLPRRHLENDEFTIIRYHWFLLHPVESVYLFTVKFWFSKYRMGCNS